LPAVKDREITIPISSGKIINLVGARRTGKTYLLLSLIKKLRETVPTNRIVYLNFEDDRLYPVSIKTMDLFLQSYYELFPENKNEKVYFFFDEIQFIENWELFVRRIYDNENCEIYLAGSSSKLLLKDLDSSLRGRSLSYEIFPLSFKEFLNFYEYEITNLSSKSIAKVINLFNQYLFSTAFPEIINFEEILKWKSLREYLDLIVYKDIVERYGVSNIHLMKYLIKFLFSNSGNLISINKIYNELTSFGLKVSRNSVYEYISYLEDSYTLFNVKLYTRNIREQKRNPSKFYVLDNGLRRLVSISEDKGKLLESVVYLHLRRSSENIYYYMGNKEVDFVLDESFQSKITLINVCYDITNPLTARREIESLVEGMKELKIKASLLLTNYQQGEEKIDGMWIKIVPAWKWLLNL
jgi:predicted AAA+ superfamily ATPase